MKKVLYSTTALAVAGMLAFAGEAVAQDKKMDKPEKIKLSVGGFFIWYGGAADNDAKSLSNRSNFNMVADSEVIFSGHTTLDNGIRVDAIIQLETDQVNANAPDNAVPASASPQHGGVVIDESYIKVGNMKQWGEFRLGSTKQAHFTFKVNAPSVNTIANALNPAQSRQFVPSLRGNDPASGEFFNHAGPGDNMSAVYITPNLNGFQGGISYTPSTNNDDNPPATEGEMPGETDAVSIGANYKGKFGDANVAVSSGWTKTTGRFESTTMQYGINVSFAGFSVGGGWAGREDDGDTTKADIEGFMAGVGYKTGPWDVALTWLNTTDDQTANPGEDESNQYTLGMTYSLGAGVTVGASIFQIKHEDEVMVTDLGDDNAVGGEGDNADTTTGGMHNEGWGVLGGIRVNF